MSHQLALIGCGGVAQMHLDGLARHADRAQIIAVCDPDAQRRATFVARYDIEGGYDSLDALLQSGDFDGFIVCTPTDVRGAVVAQLARAGRPILVEKPFAAAYDEALQMVEICENNGAALGVDQNFRYHYPFLRARQLIAEGAIGAVNNIAHRDLFFRQDGGWRTQQSRHALMVMGVHWLDGIRLLAGRDADSVYAQMRSSQAVNCAGETEANVQVGFDGGPIADYFQSFSAALNQTQTLVIGEAGTLVLDYNGIALHRRGQDVERFDNDAYAGDNKPESAWACLDELLRNGAQASNSGRDNLKTIALLEAAYRSASEGRIVRLRDGAPT